MHTVISDGTDTPEIILKKVKAADIQLFSVTDHDAVKSSSAFRELLRKGDPFYLTGVEFSCKDEAGRYHILGYGYRPDAKSMLNLVETSHNIRMQKVKGRLDILEQEYGFSFPEEEIQKLFSLDNPGKPHIGNLMVKYGYAESMNQAICDYLNKLHMRSAYIRPEQAIEAILAGSGIPVLAHPCFGDGRQYVRGGDMENRLRRLTGFGLKGVEAFYSGFDAELRSEMVAFAEQFDLYVTAGSDYHGTNKTVVLGDTGLDQVTELPERMKRFLEDAGDRMYPRR